jgi:hypothetical protein
MGDDIASRCIFRGKYARVQLDPPPAEKRARLLFNYAELNIRQGEQNALVCNGLRAPPAGSAFREAMRQYCGGGSCDIVSELAADRAAVAIGA